MAVVTFAEFLAKCSPDEVHTVEDLLSVEPNSRVVLRHLNTGDIWIECTSKQCEGLRRFEAYSGGDIRIEAGTTYRLFLDFVCRNCHGCFKTIAIRFVGPKDGDRCGIVVKLVEDPPFGSRIPSRVFSLVGPDKELFLKGWQSERHGLGIGAFAYYRPVIENQKNRLLDEIIRVAQKVGASEGNLVLLRAAKEETQFTKAIDSVKDAIPAELRIKNHNPLTLLHSALSEGLHAKTDEECLDLVHHIRAILFELAERIGEVLKEQKSLDAAIARLTSKK